MHLSQEVVNDRNKPRVITAEFEVDTTHLHSLGVMDPYSSNSLSIYTSGKLSSSERLYFSIWSSSVLSTLHFSARLRIATRGRNVTTAYFIVAGKALGINGDKIYRLGPGSVIGLAEGMAGLPYFMDVIAVSSVQVRTIHMHQINRLLINMPLGLKGILRSAVVRTLGLTDIPDSLK
jgi:CRP-like cAMP-binding protein